MYYYTYTYLTQRLEQTDVSVSWRRVLRGSRCPPGARHHGAREVTTNKLELTRFFLGVQHLKMATFSSLTDSFTD